MADKTGIEWTEATWNPVVGCSVASDGCTNCYAAREAAGRLSATPTYKGLTIRKAGVPTFTGEVRCLPERLDQPLRWGRPRLIFVNSMSDLFHPGVPTEFIADVVAVMALAPKHTFQVLTKRPNRMAQLLASGTFRQQVADAMDRLAPARHPHRQRTASWLPIHWPMSHVWWGTSVEDQANADLRLPFMRAVALGGWTTWVSAEPLLGPVILGLWLRHTRNDHPVGLDVPYYADHRGLDWVVVGGESGPRARPMHPEWARQLRDECDAAGVPFLFKQWGEWVDGQHLGERHSSNFPSVNGHGTKFHRLGKKAAGRELDGRTWDGYPERVALV